MTYNEFFEELKKLNLKWKKVRAGDGIGYIVRCERGDCPITALARSKGFIHKNTISVNQAFLHYGGKLGLTDNDIMTIVKEADHNSLPFEVE